MALLAVYVHACKHYINACDCMGNPFAQFSQHFCGNRYDIHDRIGPSVVVARLNDLNIYLLNIFLFCNKVIQHLFADRHMSVYGNIIMFAVLNIGHMECFNHKTPQIYFLLCQTFHLLSFQKKGR